MLCRKSFKSLRRVFKNKFLTPTDILAMIFFFTGKDMIFIEDSDIHRAVMKAKGGNFGTIECFVFNCEWPPFSNVLDKAILNLNLAGLVSPVMDLHFKGYIVDQNRLSRYYKRSVKQSLSLKQRRELKEVAKFLT